MTPNKTRDPVQGLVDYVLDVKPFHTKILEVWVEYIYNDPVNVTIKDKLDWEIHLDFERFTGCKYGWDTTPWDFFWNVKDVSDIATGTFRYLDHGTVKSIEKFDAYRLFFDYLAALWKSRNGLGLAPVYGDASDQNPFRVLFLPQTNNAGVIALECSKYWAETVLSNQYWFDPRIKRLYRHVGNEWQEQPFYYTSIEPTEALEGECWFCVGVNKLYQRVTTTTFGWAEITKFYIADDAPETPPIYPEPWRSNWDYPPCEGPYGENAVYARVTDLLSFEHGTEIFLFDKVAGAIRDPRTFAGDEFSANRSNPEVKYRTTVIQTSRNTYRLEREEISAITDPNNPEIANTTWTIDLNDYGFDSWNIEKARKDVKLGQYLTWKTTPQGTKLFKDTLINTQVFQFKVVNQHLVAQRVVNEVPTDIDCPWVDGAVVYLRSTSDLPTYKLPSAAKAQPLERFTPYRVVKKTGKEFSLAIADRVTGELDTASMQGLDSLSFLTPGAGRQYIGIGYPVPFMEVRPNAQDSLSVNKTREPLASPLSVLVTFAPSLIADIAVNYTGKTGSSFTGFVAEGDFSDYTTGSEIQVGNSPATANDGLWTVSAVETYVNNFASIDAQGATTPSVAPSWWNATKLGAWPQPVKKLQSEIDADVVSGDYDGPASEYHYATFSLIGVSDGIPTATVAPHGVIAEPSYSFDNGTESNAARVSIAESITFTSPD